MNCLFVGWCVNKMEIGPNIDVHITKILHKVVILLSFIAIYMNNAANFESTWRMMCHMAQIVLKLVKSVGKLQGINTQWYLKWRVAKLLQYIFLYWPLSWHGCWGKQMLLKSEHLLVSFARYKNAICDIGHLLWPFWLSLITTLQEVKCFYHVLYSP